MKTRNDFDIEQVCGYTILPARKKMWVCELDILDMVEKICCDLGITYFACFGSAIGAVRHQGFIPWDDDIDLGMLREDFEIFVQRGISQFPEYIDVQYGISEHGVDPLLRIRDSRTTGIVYNEQNKPGNKGCFVEIYPFDYVNDNLVRKIQLFVSKQYLTEINRRFRVPSIKKPANEWKKKVRNAIRRIVFSHMDTHTLWERYNSICQFQNRNKNNCKYVDTITLPVTSASGRHLFEKVDVMNTEYMDYEYTKIRIPTGYDHCLTVRYGEYMQLPPLDERGTHHQNIVFYDPERPYTAYDNSEIVDRFFRGEVNLSPIYKASEDELI